MTLKFDESNMNLSKKQKWQDTACGKYCTNNYCFGFYSCKKRAA